MPNIKSAEKRVKIIAKKTLINKMVKSNLKTTLKSFVVACDAPDKSNLKANFEKTIKIIDQAVTKGILHKNTAARKKSALAKQFNKAIV